MANTNKRRSAGAAGFAMTILLAVFELAQKPLPVFALWITLPIVGFLLLYASSGWFTGERITSGEKIGRFVFLVLVLGFGLAQIGIWLKPGTISARFESMILSPPGPGVGTGFWFERQIPNSNRCVMEPIKIVLFVSITNNQSHQMLVSGFKINSSGRDLEKFNTKDASNIFHVFGVSKDSRACATGRTVDFGAPSGIGSIVIEPTNQADFAHSCATTGNFLDQQLSQNYLAPGQTMRGWVLIKSEDYGSFPADTKMIVEDAEGQSFEYSVDVKKGDPTADILSRKFIIGPTYDLSACTGVNQ